MVLTTIGVLILIALSVIAAHIFERFLLQKALYWLVDKPYRHEVADMPLVNIQDIIGLVSLVFFRIGWIEPAVMAPWWFDRAHRWSLRARLAPALEPILHMTAASILLFISMISTSIACCDATINLCFAVRYNSDTAAVLMEYLHHFESIFSQYSSLVLGLGFLACLMVVAHLIMACLLILGGFVRALLGHILPEHTRYHSSYQIWYILTFIIVAHFAFGFLLVALLKGASLMSCSLVQLLGCS